MHKGLIDVKLLSHNNEIQIQDQFVLIRNKELDLVYTTKILVM